MELTVNTSRIENGAVIHSGLDLNRNGQLDATEIEKTIVIYDGQDGENGTDGADAEYFIEKVVDPCGDGKGVDEILLVTMDGVLAWYKNVGLVVLEDGNYVTTDKQRCKFSIINGEVK